MSLTRDEEMSTARTAAGWSVVVIEILALFLNLLALILVKRRGLSGLDMKLAALMSVCDLTMVGYKLCQFITYAILGTGKLFLSSSYGQVDGLLHILLFTVSINCVGFLAAARAWGNCFQRKINQIKWAAFFLLLQLILFIALVIVAANKGFVLMPFERYFFLDVVNSPAITSIATWLIIIYCLCNLLAVDIFYPWIANSYIKSLPRGVSHNGDYEIALKAMVFPIRRRNAIIKTAAMLLLYNLAMFPSVIVLLKEKITHQTRSLSEDVVFSCSLMSLTFFNPLILLTLHSGMWRLCMVIIKSLKKPSGSSRLWSQEYTSSQLSNIN